MDAFLWTACGVTSHRQLGGDGLHLMRYLGRQGDAAIDVASQSDGNEFVGIRGEVFALDHLAVALIAVADDGTVEIETAVVVAHLTQSQVFDMQRTEGLEMLGVGALHMQLQGLYWC